MINISTVHIRQQCCLVVKTCNMHGSTSKCIQSMYCCYTDTAGAASTSAFKNYCTGSLATCCGVDHLMFAKGPRPKLMEATGTRLDHGRSLAPMLLTSPGSSTPKKCWKSVAPLAGSRPSGQLQISGVKRRKEHTQVGLRSGKILGVLDTSDTSRKDRSSNMLELRIGAQTKPPTWVHG